MSINNEEKSNFSDVFLVHCKAVLDIAEKVANTPRGSEMTLYGLYQETKQSVIQHILNSIISQEEVKNYDIAKTAKHFMHFITTTKWWCVVNIRPDLSNGDILYRSHKIESTDLLLEDNLVDNSINMEWVKTTNLDVSGIYCLGLQVRQYPANIDGEKETGIEVVSVVPLLIDYLQLLQKYNGTK